MNNSPEKFVCVQSLSFQRDFFVLVIQLPGSILIFFRRCRSSTSCSFLILIIRSYFILFRTTRTATVHTHFAFLFISVQSFEHFIFNCTIIFEYRNLRFPPSLFATLLCANRILLFRILS